MFGFSKLDVMFGRTVADAVVHPYGDLAKPGVRFVQTTIRSIIRVRAGRRDRCRLVRSRRDGRRPRGRPRSGSHAGIWSREVTSSTRCRGPSRSVTCWQDFGGGRVIVGCHLDSPSSVRPRRARRRSWSTTTWSSAVCGTGPRSHWSCRWASPSHPRPRPRRRSSASFAERGIRWCPEPAGAGARPGPARWPTSPTAARCPTTCSSASRSTRAPASVEASGLCEDGWIPVDPLTLETSFPGVYAVGDVTSVGTPKAGVFAEGQAAVVADAIVAAAAGDGPPSEYDGRGHLLPRVRGRPGRPGRRDVRRRLRRPRAPTRRPSADLAAEKAEFGASRIRRWFGRDWSTH